MVVLCLAVDKSTGECFTAQPQRLNVAISRHKLFLVIFGDIETSQAADITQVPSTSQSIQATAEGGSKTQIRSDMFNSLINWFKEKSRVVPPATQEGSDDWGNTKPDNPAKGWSAPESSGADDVFGEPKSGDAAKAWPGTDPFVGGW